MLCQSPTIISGYPDTIDVDGLYLLIQRLGIKNIQHEDMFSLITICKWTSFDPNGNPFNTPPSRSSNTIISLNEFINWISCLGSYRYLQKKLQVILI